MHVLTLVANSALLNYIGRNYRTVFWAGIVGMVLTRQRTQSNQRLNVTAKRWEVLCASHFGAIACDA